MAGTPASTVQHADFSIDTTWGTNDDHAVAIPRKQEQRLTRCGPAEGLSMTSSRGSPKSKFLSAYYDTSPLRAALSALTVRSARL